MSGKKVVLITGCSDGGLGSALALAFHKTGKYRVIATARNLSKLQQTRAAGIEELELDVLSDESIAKCVQKLEALVGGRLDMLVNNAGAGYTMPILDVDVNVARKNFDLNVWSLVTVTQAFRALLLKTPNAKVVNQISIAAYIGMPVQGVYGASKAAANQISESLRLELKPFGVRVITLMTGAVKTNFFTNVAQAETGPALPEDSLYRVVPGGPKIMTQSESLFFDTAVSADVWAGEVVGDLSKTNPPNQIWRGTNASLVRFGCLLPTGWLDRESMKMAGLDEVEAAVKRGTNTAP